MPATNFTPIQLYRSTTASQVPTSGNLSDGELAINTNDGKLYYKDSSGVVQLMASKAGASGDVVGPASATDNAVVRFDGTTGKLVQNSVVTIADSTGDVAGVGALTMGGNLTLSGGTANGVLYLNGSKVATSGSALTFDGAILGVNGVSVGRGAGAVSSNTAVGASALAANTTGANNTASGYQALYSNTTASNNTAVGYQAGYSGTTTTDNVFVGYQAGYSATTGNGRGVFIGKAAGYANTTGTDNVCIGYFAGYTNQTGIANVYIGGGYYGSENPAGYLATGSQNTFVGYSAGNTVSTGAKNTIIGGYDGNQGGLDIRTASNYIVLSDGDGNPLVFTANNNTVALQGGTISSGTGITFPATQSASSNANTLDDYEEGTWTPAWSVSGGTITANANTSGNYVKIGRVVYIWGYISYGSHTGSPTGALSITGLPFAASQQYGQQNLGGFFVHWNTLWVSNPPLAGNTITGATTTIALKRSGTTGQVDVNFSDMDTSSSNYSQVGFFGQYQI